MTKINTGFDMQGVVQQATLPDENSLKKRKVDTPEDVNKAASGFEALLLHNMLQEMWKTTGSEGLLGENSNESQIFRDMFHQAIADEIAEGDGVGVKQFLKNELSKYAGPASNKGMGPKWLEWLIGAPFDGVVDARRIKDFDRNCRYKSGHGMCGGFGLHLRHR